jgi:hypothetical protein
LELPLFDKRRTSILRGTAEKVRLSRPKAILFAQACALAIARKQPGECSPIAHVRCNHSGSRSAPPACSVVVSDMAAGPNTRGTDDARGVSEPTLITGSTRMLIRDRSRNERRPVLESHLYGLAHAGLPRPRQLPAPPAPVPPRRPRTGRGSRTTGLGELGRLQHRGPRAPARGLQPLREPDEDATKFDPVHPSASLQS